MASEAYKVDTLIDRIIHILTGQAGFDENLDREARWSLQTAELTFCNDVNPHAFRVDTSFTTETDVATYPLADDFHQMLDDTVRFVASDFRTLQEIPLQMFHRAQLASHESSGDPTSYRIVNKDKGGGSWQIFLHPTPDTATREIGYTYRSLPEPVWNSTRGSPQLLDLRFPPEVIPLLVSGAIACGHFSRYLNQIDLAIHSKTWAEGIASAKKNNNPVVGKAYNRLPYTGQGRGRLRIPGGVHPGWWGGAVSGPVD